MIRSNALFGHSAKNLLSVSLNDLSSPVDTLGPLVATSSLFSSSSSGNDTASASSDRFDLRNLRIKPIYPSSFSSFVDHDDLSIEAYASSLRYYMGMQRKGILDPLPLADSYASHLEGALAAPFPLACETPLPADFREALSWINSTSLKQIKEFWESQISQLRGLTLNPHCSSESWYNMRPDFFRAAPSSLNIALLAQLANFTGMGGSRWLGNYIKGFPITGTICQSGVFPLTLKPDNPHPLDAQTLLEDSIGRFKARSNRRPPHSQILWKEALAQVESGWLEKPRSLNSSGRFEDSPALPLVNAFRFAVVQGKRSEPVTT